MPAANKSQALTGIFDGLTGFSRVAVAVSGGSDSMALLRLAVTWRDKPHGPKAIFALTVDHGLRSGSAEEAAQVKRWCDIHHVEHHTLNWSGEKPVSGIQAKARAARYDLMSQWCREHAVPILMTGHTADDQAETVAMRQLRTSSDRSLAAIWPENEWLGVKLFRPLLNERRAALRDYLRSVDQTWLEDPSNTNENFERVRVRNTMQTSDVANLNAQAAAAQQRVRLANDEAKTWLQLNMTVDDYAVVRLSRLPFSKLTPQLQVDVLAWVVRVAGDGQLAERATLEAVAIWIVGGGLSRRSANGAIISARRHVIEVMREPARMRQKFVAVDDCGVVEFDGRFRIFAPPGANVGPVGIPPALKRPKEVPSFAFSALPLVKMADGSQFLAINSENPAISVQLCERFRL